MRNGHHTLRGALRLYWGFAPIRPHHRTRASMRAGVAPQVGAAIRRGGLTSLAAPTLELRSPLTPLASSERRPIGGFDSRIGELKAPRLIKNERRFARVFGAPGAPAPAVYPFLSSRAGWGEKGRRTGAFLGGDSWAPFAKKSPRSVLLGFTSMWAPVTGGPRSAAKVGPQRLAQTLAALRPRAAASVEAGLAPAPELALGAVTYARLGVWGAGLRAPLAPRYLRLPSPQGRALLHWL